MKNVIKILTIPVVVISLIIFASCAKDNEDDLTISTCDTINMTYASVDSVFADNCNSCHNQNYKSGGIRTDIYSELVTIAESGELLGAITHQGGFIPMPYNRSKMSDCEISKIRNWINEGLEP